MTPLVHSFDGVFLGVEADEEGQTVILFRTQDGGAVGVTTPASQLLRLRDRIEAMLAEHPALFATRRS